MHYSLYIDSFSYLLSESEVAQSCPTLCDPVDCSLPASSLHGILQARILEWVAVSFSIISFRCLLKLSCIFSILVSRLFICNSILFSRFWIIFTVIIWNSLSGRFPISSSIVWFGGHLSCSFTYWVFLCLFILFILLCLGWPFCILAVCGVLFIVEFPHCGWGWMGGLSRFPG